jgi:hypothetical protein
LFLAKELNWIWSLFFGLLHLRRCQLVHCKGTKLNLVLGLWSSAILKNYVC